MGLETGIEWTDATWNPWRGCHKIGPGCKNCYMFREQKRYGNNPEKVVKSKTTFDAPFKWKAKDELRKGARIFTCSYSDFFIEEADDWRKDAWEIIRMTEEYWYLILTKRPKRMLEEVNKIAGKIPKNIVWMVTAENQEMADRRIPELLALKKFAGIKTLVGVSIEPQLEEISLLEYLPALDWVIVGGESGTNHREFNIEWARKLLRECRAAQVSFFMKQLGGWPNKHGLLSDFPEDLQLREFPKRLEIAP